MDTRCLMLVCLSIDWPCVFVIRCLLPTNAHTHTYTCVAVPASYCVFMATKTAAVPAAVRSHIPSTHDPTMSDDEDAMMLARSATDGDAEKDAKATQSSTSDDDDSSSSSSGSSSSSDSSDSESDGEGESHSAQQAHAGDRKYSTESVASSNGFARTERSTAEPLTDVNSNRAAARFREQNSEVGLMALGTKKRDRRTIEEIQRDLQKKRSRAGSSGLLGGNSKPFTAASGAARASPPKGSPVLSPEPSGATDASQLAVGLPQIKMPKGKPNSARSRLTMKLLGRGRPNPVPAPKPAVVKKAAPAPAAANSGALSGGMGIVTNISAGAKAAKSSTSSVSSNDLGTCHWFGSLAQSVSTDRQLSLVS